MKLDTLLHAMGLSIARYLTAEIEAHSLIAPEPIERLRGLLRPGCVIHADREH